MASVENSMPREDFFGALMRPNDLLNGNVAGAAWGQCLHDCAQGLSVCSPKWIGVYDVNEFACYVFFGISHQPLLLVKSVGASRHDSNVRESVDAQRGAAAISADNDILHSPPWAEQGIGGPCSECAIGKRDGRPGALDQPRTNTGR